MPLAHWVHDWSPFFIRFSENFGIRYYGLAYLAGFAAGVALLWLYWKKGRSPFGPTAISDLITVIIVGVLVGGRLGYFLLYQLDAVFADPLLLVRVWEGGMASHGGFLGVLIAMIWWARRRQVPFFNVADLIVTTAAAGFLFGRIANFINGELVGKATTVAWAVIFPHNEIDRALGQAAMPRHPSQLYAAVLEGALILAFMQWRFWKTNVYRDQPGRLSGEYLIAYAVARVIGEMFREPDASLFLGLSRGTFLFAVHADGGRGADRAFKECRRIAALGARWAGFVQLRPARRAGPTSRLGHYTTVPAGSTAFFGTTSTPSRTITRPPQ